MLEMERLMQARVQRQGSGLATDLRGNEHRGEKRKGEGEKRGEEEEDEGEGIGKTGEMGKRRRGDVDEM